MSHIPSPPGAQLPREVRSGFLPFRLANEAPEQPKSDGLERSELSDIPELTYEDLPADEKRIRLLRFRPGLLCEMLEAEFDDYQQLAIVTSPKVDEPSNKGSDLYITRPIGDYYDNSDEDHKSDEKKGKLKPPRKKAKREDIIEYEALSWRWGDENNGRFTLLIKSKGGLFQKRVSETLGLALKYLRLRGECILWIDAICINQKNYEERSAQVAMMSLIYTSAKQVCVWIGEDDEDSTMAIKFIKDEITKLKNFDKLCTDKKYAAQWKALLVLMQRPWFSRRWVVQEITLARNATIYCGPDEIPWGEFAIAVELFVDVETATHRLSELMKKDDKFALIPSWFEHISELGASLLVNATGCIFRDYKGDSEAVKSRHQALARRSLLSLEYLVTSLSIFDCGRPHDSVYALVAIARDAHPFPPTLPSGWTKEALIGELFADVLEQRPYPLDYNKPYPDVCKDFIEFCINRTAKSDPTQALDILCRPWAKDWRVEDQKRFELEEQSQPAKPTNTPESPSRLRYFAKAQLGALKIKLKAGEIDPKAVESASSAWWKDMWTRTKALIDSLTEYSDLYWDLERTGQNDKYPERAYYFEVAKRRKKKISEAELQWKGVPQSWFKKKGVGLDSEDTKSPASEVPPATEPQKSQGTKKRKTKKQRQEEAAAAAEAQAQAELNPQPKDLELPSWAPQISGAPYDIFAQPGIEMTKMGRKNADPLVGTPQDGHRSYSAAHSREVDMEKLKFRRWPRCGHYSLYARGFRLDVVEQVSPVSQSGAIPASWLELAGWTKALRPTRGSDPGDPPVQFWRTLVADRGRYDRNPPYYYARACKETIMKGGLCGNAVDTTSLIYNERNSIIAEFCRRVQAVIWNKALIKTRTGALGLASEEVQPGDFVCIIYGCTVPIILRKEKVKTKDEKKRERYEDRVEAMREIMAECVKKRARRARYYQNASKEWRQIIRNDIKKWEQKLNKMDKPDGEKKPIEQEEDMEEYPKDVESWSDDPMEDDYSSESDESDEDGDEGDGEAGEGDAKDRQPDARKVNEGAAGKTENDEETRKKSADEMDDSPDDETGDSDNEQEENEEKLRQNKANIRDPYRYYKFLGEAYIDGMMDGEAVRRKFYKMKPDHVFEMR